MKIVIYSQLKEEPAAGQAHDLCSRFPHASQWVDSHGEFVKEVRRCFSGETIIVFFAVSSEDLAFLESMKAILLDTKLLLNLFTEDRQLIARAYKLHPRLLTTRSDPPELLSLALQGIAHEIERCHEKESSGPGSRPAIS